LVAVGVGVGVAMTALDNVRALQAEVEQLNLKVWNKK
jgi:hypothetical protein